MGLFLDFFFFFFFFFHEKRQIIDECKFGFIIPFSTICREFGSLKDPKIRGCAGGGSFWLPCLVCDSSSLSISNSKQIDSNCPTRRLLFLERLRRKRTRKSKKKSKVFFVLRKFLLRLHSRNEKRTNGHGPREQKKTLNLSFIFSHFLRFLVLSIYQLPYNQTIKNNSLTPKFLELFCFPEQNSKIFLLLVNFFIHSVSQHNFHPQHKKQFSSKIFSCPSLPPLPNTTRTEPLQLFSPNMAFVLLFQQKSI